MRTAKWLHFATHGEFDPKRPESSGIVLGASSPGEESLLTSEEILELNLSADLVVLSGCQTGLGKQLRGEGIVGLTRAFMYAGAQSLAVSLWKVEDRSTAELMVHFYGAMLNGESRADALRAAKLELIRSEEEWSHPFFWAPFVLVGPS